MEPVEKPKRHNRKPPAAGKGRKPGSVNKSTADVRAAMAVFAEGNVQNFSEWMQRVAETDPGKAATLYLQAIEYHIPKLARTELVGNNGGPVQVAAIDASKLSEDQLRALSSIDIPDA